MKAEEFVQALNDVDDKYIEEAARYRKPAGNLKLWRGIAVAACVCLAGTLAFSVISMNSGQKNTASGSRSADAVAAYSAAAGDYPMEEAEFEEDFYYDNAVYEMEVYDDDAAPLYKNAAAADGGTVGAMGNAFAAGDAAEPDSVPAPDKVIYNVYIDMDTTGFDQALADLESLIRIFDGYCESQYVSNYSRDYRSATYTIRIPAENLDEFLERAQELCTVTYIRRNAQNVSEEYYDTQGRLETAKAMLERLQELLEIAEDMEDIITIEDAISETQWEIDSYGSTLKYYDSHVRYSTVTIDLSEVYEVVVEEPPMTFGDRVSQAFSQGIKSVGDFFRNLVIWLANSWIWLIVIIVVVIVIVVILCSVIRKHKDRKHKSKNTKKGTIQNP